MTDERQIDDTTVMEKDGSGNLIIKNIDEATLAKVIGQIGGPSNRSDIYGDSGDFNLVNADSLSITPVVDNTLTLSAGGGAFVEVGTAGDFGKPYFATAVPASNDDEFKPTITKWRNRTSSSFGVVVEEVKGNTGGDVRVIVHKIGV